MACGSLTAVPLISQAERVPDPLRKQHFVLVHGAWHGGWAWKYVAEHLIRAGHSVTTPTLSGLGEHSHTATTAIDLSTHVEDIVSHIVMEDLSDVVLVGHSYAGMVLPGVLASINERIDSTIFFDAFTPKPGQALSDFIPESDKAEQMKHQEKGELALTGVERLTRIHEDSLLRKQAQDEHLAALCLAGELPNSPVTCAKALAGLEAAR